MNKSMRITLSGIVLALLAGCGAKGPLILPEKAVPIEVPTETTPEATPESVPSVDAAPQVGDAVEIPAPPAKDD